jgi:uncharacterized protein with HEPN domain
MSSRDWIFRIKDILQSIDKISLYLADMTLNQFQKNELTIDAIIRNFEIIGEASNHIPLTIRSCYTDIPWEQMKGMRNILIHEYFGVDVKTVWYTAKNHLPFLKKQLETVLLEQNPPSN